MDLVNKSVVTLNLSLLQCKLTVSLDKGTLSSVFFKTLFTWSGGPRSSGVGFFCFVSPRA